MSYNPNDKAKVKDVISLAQYSAEKIKNEINNLELPTASTTTKGLVKVGNGLSIDNTGTLNAISDTILNTIPSSINGGLWYEIEDGTPVIKQKISNNVIYELHLTPYLPSVSPHLSVVTVNLSENRYIITLNYLGTGTISFSPSSLDNDFIITYNTSAKQITIQYDDSLFEPPSYTYLPEFTIAISASPGYLYENLTLYNFILTDDYQSLFIFYAGNEVVEIYRETDNIYDVLEDFPSTIRDMYNAVIEEHQYKILSDYFSNNGQIELAEEISGLFELDYDQIMSSQIVWMEVDTMLNNNYIDGSLVGIEIQYDNILDIDHILILVPGGEELLMIFSCPLSNNSEYLSTMNLYDWLNFPLLIIGLRYNYA